MPVRVSMFACEFRCGRVSAKHDPVAKHEPTCFLNPARRACKTCKHEQFFDDGRNCAAGVDLGEKDIRFDCEKWEGR
ncbi:MAG: hypothetical protein WCV62_05920 [Candidatus Peribacteraceae bacterium]|jgi:hypothetical protein